ncbi:MAG: 30S ribosomal protein S6e [Candidatus Bathyarchaeota archaeon BA2]|nr:MAG: 30S ribosomal protein S6e [Candidatus Bathyarchaeota archaeon BA2]
MAKFKIIISDPETGKSRFVEVEGTQAVPLVGRKLGEIIDGSVVKLSGHKLKITGGSDKDGFPMRPNVHGGVRVRAILSEGVGFHSSQRGERQRKTIRGNVITEDIVQISMKIVETPKKPKEKKKVEKWEKKGEGGSTEEPAQTT